MHYAQYFEKVDVDDVLPVVVVKDPLTWQHSMCRMEYAAHFRHGQSQRASPAHSQLSLSLSRFQVSLSRFSTLLRKRERERQRTQRALSLSRNMSSQIGFKLVCVNFSKFRNFRTHFQSRCCPSPVIATSAEIMWREEQRPTRNTSLKTRRSGFGSSGWRLVLSRDSSVRSRECCMESPTRTRRRATVGCLEIVPLNRDVRQLSRLESSEGRERNATLAPVETSGKEQPPVKYKSLTDLWSRWNGDYLDMHGPRLLVRYEDLLWRTRETDDVHDDSVDKNSQSWRVRGVLVDECFERGRLSLEILVKERARHVDEFCVCVNFRDPFP